MTNEDIIAELQTILDTHNPCAIKVVNGKATCRNGKPCCTGCPFLTDKGCSTVCHCCKFYFCETAWYFLPKSIQTKIEKLGKQYKGLLYQRNSKRCPPVVNPPFRWETAVGLPFHHDPFFNGYKWDTNKKEWVLVDK